MGMSDAAPHKILFVQNLPTATTDAMLAMLFQQFPGYKETRMVRPLAVSHKQRHVFASVLCRSDTRVLTKQVQCCQVCYGHTMKCPEVCTMSLVCSGRGAPGDCLRGV